MYRRCSFAEKYSEHPLAEFIKSSVDISRAAGILRRGGLVAFPTETVYGLGADALNPTAVCRIFEAKKRPKFDPLIVHVASFEQAALLWKGIDSAAVRLIKKFWPGPLAIVLPKSSRVPDIVTAGLSTVAVRMPAHPMALDLIRALGRPIAAPSANLFGRTSPTTAKDVREDLGKKVDLVLDGGPCRVGVESTVVTVENGRAFLLRPGGVSVEEIREVIPVSLRALGLRRAAPGFLKSHYAPRTPMVLMDHARAFIHDHPDRRLGLLSHSRDLRKAASKLFQAMRKLDKMKPELIVAEKVPPRGFGLAIMDRLKKACGGRTGRKTAERMLRDTRKRKVDAKK